VPKTKKQKKGPALTPLQYGTVYCELCKNDIHAGQPVAWWRISQHQARARWAAYCATCHWANVRQGQPLR
jgi:hypothetical protein